MNLTSFQPPELRDANNNIVQDGTYSVKNGVLANAQNTGVLDYINNNLQALQNNVVSLQSSSLVWEYVDALPVPSEANPNAIYAVPAEDEQGNRYYIEYRLINGTWQVFGSTKVDITQAVMKSDVLDNISTTSALPVRSAVIANALNEKADKGDTYTKTETNGLINTLDDNKADVNGDKNIFVEKNSGGASFSAKSGGQNVFFGVGSSDSKRGIYDVNASRWIVMCDGDDLAPKTSTSPTNDSNDTHLATTAFVNNQGFLKGYTQASNSSGKDYITFASCPPYEANGVNSDLRLLVSIGRYSTSHATALYLVYFSNRFSPYLFVQKIAGMGSTSDVNNTTISFGYYITKDGENDVYNLAFEYKLTYRGSVKIYTLENRNDLATLEMSRSTTVPSGWTVVNTRFNTYINSENAVGDTHTPIYVKSNGIFEAIDTSNESFTNTITWDNTYVSSVTSARTSLTKQNNVYCLKVGLTLTSACASASSYITIGTTTVKPKTTIYGVLQYATSLDSIPFWINSSGNISIYAKGATSITTTRYGCLTWLE